jgi:uncharacterized integral membrane protein
VKRKFVLGLLVVPLAVVLIALAIANRKPVTLTLDPFGGAESMLAFDLPLFFLLLSVFAMGLIVGGFATWLGQGKWRRNARARSREVREWRHQADRLEKELEGVDPSAHRPQLHAD